MASLEQKSLSTQYDFPKFVFISRSTQLVAIALELISLHSASASLGLLSFLLFTCLIILNVVHIGCRWFYNIDGRYDLQQLVKEQNMQNKLQYGIALFLPAIMGFITWRFIPCGDGLGSTVFHGSALIQMIAALVLLGLEVYEVYVK